MRNFGRGYFSDNPWVVAVAGIVFFSFFILHSVLFIISIAHFFSVTSHINPLPLHLLKKFWRKPSFSVQWLHKKRYKICNYFPADNYMFRVDNRNTRARCKICSELTIKTPERRHWRRSGVFIVNFENILHLVLVFLLLTLSR